jgi:hypothetical protein
MSGYEYNALASTDLISRRWANQVSSSEGDHGGKGNLYTFVNRKACLRKSPNNQCCNCCTKGASHDLGRGSASLHLCHWIPPQLVLKQSSLRRLSPCPDKDTRLLIYTLFSYYRPNDLFSAEHQHREGLSFWQAIKTMFK